jgi:hypothetical protein
MWRAPDSYRLGSRWGHQANAGLTIPENGAPVRQRRLTVACIASVLACVLVPTAASAGVGTISTFAGSPVFGPVSATSIGAVGNAAGVTIGGTTYAYVADGAENVVRRVDLSTGQAQVIAGNGGYAAPTASVPATSTPTGGPEDVTVDAAGDFAFQTSRETVFVPAASGSYFGQSMIAGDIYNLGITTETIALEPGGSLVYDYDGTIRVDPVTTGISTGLLASGDIDNLSIAADPAHDGNFAFVVGDTGPSKAGHEIDYYAAHAGTYFGLSMSEGINAVADTANEGDFGVDSGDGGPATSAIVNPGDTAYYSLAFDAVGDLLVLDTGEDGIHDGQQRLVAATSCTSGCLYGLTATTAGYIYRTELPAKTIAIAGSEDVFADEGFTGNALYSPIGTDEGIVVGDGTYGYDGDGSTGASSELATVSWVASDPAGDVAIVDSADSRVRFMPASSGSFYGQSMTAGHLYTVAGNGILAPESGSSGYGGDEGPATVPAAKFDTFADGSGVALDDSGDLAIADPGNGRVRFVPASSGTFYGKTMTAGYVYTIASSLTDPMDVTFDAKGDVIVADGSDIRKVEAGTGTVTTITIAAGSSADGVAVDTNGDIAYSDENDSVFLIPASSGKFFNQTMTAGEAALVAGGTKGYSGDDATATSAALNEPYGLAFDRFGDLVIAQQGEQPFSGDLVDPAVRFLPASSGSFYGQSMTEGDIYTIAGQASGGFSGDGGPGPAAKLSQATSVAMSTGEDVLIADAYNNRVRVVSGSVPTATTGAAGTATAVSDTVNGSVNPQGRPIGYHFEYGTTTAYEASQPAPDRASAATTQNIPSPRRSKTSHQAPPITTGSSPPMTRPAPRSPCPAPTRHSRPNGFRSPY